MVHRKSGFSGCILLVFTAALFDSSSAQCPASAVVRIEQDSPTAPCSDGLVCTGTLQAAIDYVATTPVNSSGPAGCESVVIQIPDGQHNITHPTYFGNRNVHFIGSGDDVTVSCDYFADESITNTSQMHTWYFNYSESVVLSNIHFRSCGFPFRLSTLRYAEVHNCTFRYFTQAVLDIFNCQNVSVRDILVENNTGTVTFAEAFRGNTGGVAIGYNSLPVDYTSPTVEVVNSVFKYNHALSGAGIELVIASGIFVGRGGGLGIFVDEKQHNLSILVSECVFEHNFANNLGGGLFLTMYSRPTAQHYVLIEKTRVIYNTALVAGGGGIQLSHELARGDSRFVDTIQVQECHFENNQSPSGGGLYIVPGNDGFFQVERCNFTGNRGFGRSTDYGGAMAVSLVSVFNETVTLRRHEVKDCSFVSNSGRNGVFTVGYTPVKFLGSNVFIGNTGPSLQIVGGLVEFEGHVKFVENRVGDTGALYMLSFAQIRFTRGLKMDFEGNIGQNGAGIVVGAPTSLSAFNELLFNPQCFVLYENRSSTPSDWENVTVTFTHNEALVASAVSVSRIDTCSWFRRFPPFFNDTYIRDWPIWKYINNSNTGLVEPLDQKYSFGTTVKNLFTSVQTVSAWPGQRISMQVTGLDQFNDSTVANAQFIKTGLPGSADSNFRSNLRFSPEIAVIAGNLTTGLLDNEFLLSYGIVDASVTKMDSFGEISVVEPFNSQPVLSDSFTLQYLPCPGGYQLTVTSRNLKCTCFDTPEILVCEANQDSIIIKNGFWAGYTPLRQLNLFFYPCPAGYCRCTFNSSLNSTCVYKYTHSDPNLQCDSTREGILCGRCKGGRGVTVLLERCDSCSNGMATLLILLIIADVVVFVGITLLDTPIPGWIYPFVFYIQLAPYVSWYYPESFRQAGELLYYVGSATSFYFVYDFCLFSNLNAQASYILRYFPACTAAITFLIIWAMRKYALKRRVKSVHHGSWWFVLLSFSLVVHTSLSILNCPSIPNVDGSTTKRWFVNGEVQCFTGGHMVLTLVAILVLLFCILVLIIVVVLPLAKPKHFKRFITPLTVNYKEEVKWWSGVELGRRFLFLLFFIYFPRNTVWVILVLVVVIAVYGYVQPYKSRVANLLELVVQVNFLIFMLLEATTVIREDLFVFPELNKRSSIKETPRGLSLLSWLLLPFYYFPLVLLIAVGCGYLIIYLRRKYLQRKKTGGPAELHVQGFLNSFRIIKSPLHVTQTVMIDHGVDGGEADTELQDGSTVII